jgi:hypothetical protein
MNRRFLLSVLPLALVAPFLTKRSEAAVRGIPIPGCTHNQHASRIARRSADPSIKYTRIATRWTDEYPGDLPVRNLNEGHPIRTLSTVVRETLTNRQLHRVQVFFDDANSETIASIHIPALSFIRNPEEMLRHAFAMKRFEIIPTYVQIRLVHD